MIDITAATVAIYDEVHIRLKSAIKRYRITDQQYLPQHVDDQLFLTILYFATATPSGGLSAFTVATSTATTTSTATPHAITITITITIAATSGAAGVEGNIKSGMFRLDKRVMI